MPLSRGRGAAAMRRQIAKMTKGASARLAGKTRGPDHSTERGWRTPHAESFDADRDPKAKPWRPFGDGSFKQGQAHREALIQAAEEDYQLGYAETSFAELREVRRNHEALSAELDAMIRDPVGRSPGRQATVRIELGRLEARLDAEDQRLRRLDVDVLKAVLQPICFATGKLFPSIDWIAAKAGCHRNSVINALRRLKWRGFLSWVRRTIQTRSDPGRPQREQTSNAYFFEHRAKMRPRLWQRFTQILTAKLRRLGFLPAGVEPPPAPSPSGPLGQALAGLAAAVDAALPLPEPRAQ